MRWKTYVDMTVVMVLEEIKVKGSKDAFRVSLIESTKQSIPAPPNKGDHITTAS
jgi:hypothetical protein